ncbi:MAG: calcineurin-like phosphoesterase C-terminal domain-containing protein [Parvularculaceae bacterium]|nr:calcineurin-like phosphoesterase C-terminal domain-containing protein [Parvularculaceae bacterium]
MRAFLFTAALAALALAACETVEPTVDTIAEPVVLEAPAAPMFADYRGAPEVIRGRDGGAFAKGVVFEDLNRNGRRDEGEPGVQGVKVTNGLDVTLTGADGAYELAARADMALMVVQPKGYQVPHNEHWVPQFAYQHKPEGSPKLMRYGGLPATGLMPEAVNFPLVKAGNGSDVGCIILGDTQAYSNQEISYFRDSTIDDLLDREEKPDCVIAVGDVVGDDLGLIPRMAEVIGTLKTPQWWIHGNHDYDIDADYDEDSADSWRHLAAPAYYAFEIGDAIVIAIDNVVYPCTKKDAETPGHDYCVTSDRKAYNGRITDEQMIWIENILALTDPEKLVIFAHHIPFVTFYDETSPVHQTDNVTALYAMVRGREALSLSGHTHTTEVFEPGDSFAGWKTAVGVEALPFRHIVAGAASGAWYQGDFGHDGTPMALQRMGAPKGWLRLDIQGTDYQETYRGANVGRERRMWVSVNTPIFRSWLRQILAWRDAPRSSRDPIPPLSINDLPDVKIITPRDLQRGTYVTANVWDGSTSTEVTLNINATTYAMERTQAAQGEAGKVGPEWADPYAVQRQVSVGRFAFESRSGIERNQGVEAFKGSRWGPMVPQPQGAIADRNVHLWRAPLPTSLPLGIHKAVVEATDRHGRKTKDTIVIEVRTSLPPARFRKDAFEAFEDGPPIR